MHGSMYMDSPQHFSDDLSVLIVTLCLGDCINILKCITSLT